MKDMSDTVLLEVSGRIAHVKLNRPERLNAINPALLDDFADKLQQALDDGEVDVILLSGEGRAFCAGDDLKEFEEQAIDAEGTRVYAEQIQKITKLIVLGDKIVVGAIHGWAVGGGLEWVINCDIAVAGEGARFFFPETRLGLFVTGGITAMLPSLVGLQRAKELILLGEKFDAGQAREMGIVSRVVPDVDVLDTARALADDIVTLPAIARRNVKTVFNRAFQQPIEDVLALEVDATVEGFLDPDSKRRVADAI
jgi:enoyl-CoA hydratase/carnithine racemase